MPRVKIEKVKPKSRIEAFSKLMDEGLGSGVVNLIGSDNASIHLDGVVSTKFETVDAAIGRGGVPLGRLTILHGSEGSAKTTIALCLASEVQKMGGLVLYMDTEHKLDPLWAEKCGINIKEMFVSQPGYLEKAFYIMSEAIKKTKDLDCPLLIVLDSMNATQSKQQFDAEWEEDAYYGPQARVFSQKLPKLMDSLTSKTALVFISQPRSGPNATNKIACGNAPKFYAALIVQFSPSKSGKFDKVGSRIVGTNVEAWVVKNQVAPPYQKANIKIGLEGPDFEQALLDRASDIGVISKGGGGWYEWSRNGGNLKFQGRNGWIKKLEENKKLRDELRSLVRNENK